MTTKEYKEYLEMKIWKLKIRQNINLRAFLINYIAVFVVWIITMTPIMDVAANMMKMSPELTNVYMMVLIGIWKVLAAVLFLIPGLATWWERCSLAKTA